MRRGPIIAAALAALFVELVLLRYLSGCVRVLGYYTHFVLLAVFLGFGLGITAHRRWPSRTAIGRAAPWALGGLIAAALGARGLRIEGTPGDIVFLAYQTGAADVPLVPFMIGAFLLVAGGTLPIGYLVGHTLAGDRALSRYILNVVGSLGGIVAFAAVSGLGLQPAAWVALSFTILLVAEGWALGWRAPAAVASILLGVGATVWVAQVEQDTQWSPYQKVSVDDLHLHPEHGLWGSSRFGLLPESARAAFERLPHSEGFLVTVNDDSFQKPLDLSDAAVARRPALKPMRQQFDVSMRPLEGLTGKSVLVLGAGTGNDVAAALRAGATRVDAVEIDPAILALGERHPERPYADPRVSVHADDARAFLGRADRRWDLIVFGMLDSHVLSGQSNVRQDGYVFTRESFELCRAALNPGGVLVVSHAVGSPWFVTRMRATLAAAFERPPLMLSDLFQHPSGFIYAVGDTVNPGPPVAGVAPLEDDWPFVYLEDRSVPAGFLWIFLAIGVLSVASVFGVAGRRLRPDLHFFALGAAFMLIETRAISVTSVLVGATWGVHAAVFAGVLGLALAGALVAARLPPRRPDWAYALLFVSLVVAFVVAPAQLIALPALARAAVGATLAVLPLFASGIIFAASLARRGHADNALAWNLMGAVCGGCLEYVALITGFGYLIVVGGLLYLVALAADLRVRAGA